MKIKVVAKAPPLGAGHMSTGPHQSDEVSETTDAHQVGAVR
jgi:hypothetical protein